MSGPAREAGGPHSPTEGPDAGRRAVVTTSLGVGVLGTGAALVVLGPVPVLRWFGLAVAALGVVVLAVPRSRPAGTGDEEPWALDEERGGTVFAWSRYAPTMTLLVFASTSVAAGALVLVAARIGLPVFVVFFAMLAVVPLAVAVRLSVALRRRRVVVATDGVLVELRGRGVSLPWSTITAVDVAAPRREYDAMGGAITLTTVEHTVPGPPRLQQRLRALAAPYPGADVALPVAGLRQHPGDLLAALERGVGRAGGPAG